MRRRAWNRYQEEQVRWRIAMKVGQGGAGIKVGPGESLHPCSAKNSAEQLVSHKQNLLVQ